MTIREECENFSRLLLDYSFFHILITKFIETLALP